MKRMMLLVLAVMMLPMMAYAQYYDEAWEQSYFGNLTTAKVSTTYRTYNNPLATKPPVPLTTEKTTVPTTTFIDISVGDESDSRFIFDLQSYFHDWERGRFSIVCWDMTVAISHSMRGTIDDHSKPAKEKFNGVAWCDILNIEEGWEGFGAIDISGTMSFPADTKVASDITLKANFIGVSYLHSDNGYPIRITYSSKLSEQ